MDIEQKQREVLREWIAKLNEVIQDERSSRIGQEKEKNDQYRPNENK